MTGVRKLLLPALLLAIGPPAPMRAQTAPLRPARLDVVFSGSLFGSASRADAVAAIRIWGNMVGRRKGFQVDSVVNVVDDLPEIRKRILAGSVMLLGVDVFEYFQLAEIPAVEPVFYASRAENGGATRYVLVVRDEPGISLENLRGRKAIVHFNTSANLGLVWLESVLQEARLSHAERFFAATENVAKPSLAVLPVFFGKADAAVVDETSYELSREMNPQLGKKLRVLRTSPPMPEAIVCVASKQIEFRKEMLESMADLHHDIQGKQILTVFRFGRMLPVDPVIVVNVRELWRKHLAWSKGVESAPAAHPAKPGRQISGEGGGQ
jgi:ABC-type phosphate/phosphonate transport system substrate-binding protein